MKKWGGGGGDCCPSLPRNDTTLNIAIYTVYNNKQSKTRTSQPAQ